MRKNKVSVSLLNINFANLKEEVKSISNSGADSIHLDIMDGNFVSNISFGSDIVSVIKRESALPLKSHLMVKEPQKHIDAFINAGSNTIIFHQEALVDSYKVIDEIKKKGVRVGVSITPSTHENVLEYMYKKLDEILIMTVNPGIGGQEFLDCQLKKIANISVMTNDIVDIDIGVDGGINPANLRKCSSNGANLAVVGNYILKGNNYKLRVDNIRDSF